VSTLARIGVAPDAARLDRAGTDFPARVRPGPARFSKTQHRYLSIDILRAVAILLMIQVHFVEYLSSNFQSPKLLYDLSESLGLVPAPFFTFLSGLSYSLWLEAQKRAGRSADQIVKYSARRGMFVFVLGFAVNIFIWLPPQTFIWDILTLLGASALILTAVRNWRPGTLVAISILILVASPPLRELSHYESYWVGTSFDYEFNLTEVLLGFLLNGYFPLLPWLVFPLIGFALGQYFYPHDADEEASLPLIIPLLGTLLVAVALIGVLFEPYVPEWFAKYYANDWPEDFYPATTVFVIFFLGGTILCLWVLNHAIDLNRRITGTGRVLTFFRLYSYFAMTTYVVHLAAHIWPMWIAATWEQKASIQFYVGNSVSTPVALGLAPTFIVLFYPCLFFLKRHAEFSLEHVMRWCCD
jgi:uncharacterized membrane protein